MILSNSYAKVNLFLHVGEKLHDGYHKIDSLMQEITLADEIIVEKRDDKKIVITSSVPIPLKENLCYKAAELFMDTYKISSGVSISIKKNIPLGAGLGGGSSNAATVIKSMNNLFRVHASVDNLIPLGRKIGSDVPFFLFGKSARIQETGEKITPMSEIPKLWFVLIYPNIPISTKEVYLLWDERGTSTVSQEININSIQDLIYLMKNDLEEVVFSAYPELRNIKESLLDHGARHVMLSGSGSTVFGAFDSEVHTKKTAEKIKRKEWQIFVAHSV